jgi:hypothetical protein
MSDIEHRLRHALAHPDDIEDMHTLLLDALREICRLRSVQLRRGARAPRGNSQVEMRSGPRVSGGLGADDPE